VKVVRTRVGDRYVVEEMRKHGYALGGEQSGHLVFLDHATTGDGTLAALQVLAVMCRSGKRMSELTKIFEPVPQVLLNVMVKEKRDLSRLPAVTRTIGGVEKKLGKDGRVLVRYSGTEPKVRVLVEGTDAKKIKAYAEEIGDSLRKSLGA
jgi:phosphoglucosamine mutase